MGFYPDIVLVTKEAAALLAALHLECFSGKERWDIKAFSELLSMRGTIGWVIEVEGEPAGLLIVRHVSGEYEILTLGVRRALQKRGIGRRLMAMFMTMVRQQEATVFLEVKVNNDAAFRLYSSFGFTQVGHRKRYYPDGADARVLSFLSL